MKFLITLLLYFLSFQCFAQSMEGEWKGSFSYDPELPFSNRWPIKIYFVLNKDSSYKVYSYSKGKDAKGKDTIIVCKVIYTRISEDSLYLEEVQILKPKNALPACFQKMYLKIKRKEKGLLLEGTWQSEGVCFGTGQIRFEKK